MADNALVIPAAFRVGKVFPEHLPLADGSLKPLAECSRAEVAEAVRELRQVARLSRNRLEAAYTEHVQDIELLAQVSAYLARFDTWAAVRNGGELRETLWHLDGEDAD
jgi:hypothetical protein